MGGKAASILIRILSDATNFSKGIDQAKTDTDKLGAGFKSAVLPATAILAGATAGALLLRDAAEENVISNSRLEQVFRSMGDATGGAAKQAEAYADTLSKQIGIEDDTIKAAQAKLATFANVSDETARQAGIFDRATAAAADLASAGFGDLTSNATQLGKALQDPIKGTTMLTRSGVTLTDQQKAQIKAMVKAGDTLGAQKLILSAIETQVGGTAAATATSSAKQKVAWKELQESLGGQLLPMFDKLNAVMMDVFAWISSHLQLVITMAAVISGLALAVVTVNAAMTTWKAITTVTTVAQAAFNLVMAANPIVLIVIAIAALVAGLIYFFTQTKLGKEVWANVWGFIKSSAQAVATWFTGTLVPWFQAVWAGLQAGLAAIGNFFAGVWNGIVAAVQFAVAFVRAAIDAFLLPLQIAWQLFWGVFGGVLTAAWNAIVAAVQFAVTLVQVIIFQVWNAIAANAQVVWSGFMAVITTVWNALVGAVTWYLTGLWNVISATWNIIASVSSAVWGAISGAVSAAWTAITGAVTSAVGAVQQWISAAWNTVQRLTTAAWNAIPSGIKDKIGEAVGFIAHLPGRALDALGDIGSNLLGAGKSLIQGFINGITRSFGSVQTTLQDLTNKLTSWKGPADRDANLLKGAGQLVIEGFITGLESKYDAAKRSLQGFTADLAATPGPTLAGAIVGGSAAAAQWVAGSAGGFSKADMSPNFAVYVQAIPDGEYVRTEARVVAQGEILAAGREYLYGRA